MKPFSIRRKVEAFRGNESGSFATIAGVTAIAIMLSAGIALDYSRIAHTKTIVNDALDAAVLAAGTELSSGRASGAELEQNFRDFFEANLESRSATMGDITISRFEADAATGRISAEAKAVVKTTLMAIAGTKEVDMRIPAEAVFSSDAVEVAMVLDVTGSMGSAGKLDALRQAARDAVTILLPENASSDKMRIGIVPYSWSVNAGSYAAAASANRAGNDDCVTERGRAQAATDAFYTVEPVEAAINACPSQPVQPLTNSRSTLINEINSFRADGYTAGHIGIAWGYYMLSENWRPLWRGAEPARYSDPVRKVAIVMTDGEFNTYYYGVRGNYNNQSARSTNAAQDLCTDMKRSKSGKPGITIYTIAFQAPTSARRLLRDCASSDSGESKHFFAATDAAELREAFAAIAVDIQKLRLTR